MPTYHFNLITNVGQTTDPEGTEFADEAEAEKHACAVARELMQNREATTRGWRIRVCDHQGRSLFEVPFVTLDPTLASLDPLLQDSVARVVVRTGQLGDAIRDVRRSILQIRSTMASADGTIQLASVDGVRLI